MIQANKGTFYDLSISGTLMDSGIRYPQVIVRVVYDTPYFERDILLELVFSLTPTRANPQPFMAQGFDRDEFTNFVELFLQEQVEPLLIEKIVDVSDHNTTHINHAQHGYPLNEAIRGKCVLPVGINNLAFVDKKNTDKEGGAKSSNLTTVEYLVQALKSLDCAVAVVSFEPGEANEKERAQAYLDRVVDDANW